MRPASGIPSGPAERTACPFAASVLDRRRLDSLEATVTYSLDGYGRAVLRLTPRRHGDRLLIKVGGELDLATADHLPNLLRGLGPDDCRDVHLDLTELDFIDLAGLTALRRADDVVRGRAGRMTIGGLRPLARRLAELTGLPLTVGDDATPGLSMEDRAR